MVSFINKYIFLKKIGQGSYGEVWLVRQKESDNKKFVLKKISFSHASKKEMESARQECQLLKKLDHPNIVQYRDSFEENNSLYIAMSFCEEGDLYTRLKNRKNVLLSEKQIIEWLIQITMALSYIHERNILHRDLKTQNVFITKSVIKIGDLGIAKQLENKIDMAKTVIGTPYYMSPELFAKKPYNFKSDIWSLGCVTYEMATLKHAFNAKDYTSLAFKILNGQTPDIAPTYSKDLINLIKDMLNKNPDRRPPAVKILCNPFIRQHIEMFVEKSKKKHIKIRKSSNPSEKRSSIELLKPSHGSSNNISQNSDNHSNNGNSPKESDISNEPLPKSLPKEKIKTDYDDNDDVVIVRSSNESHSKISPLSSQKENCDISRQPSKTDLEKEFDKNMRHENSRIFPVQGHNEKLLRSNSLSQLKEPSKSNDSMPANAEARQRRRQKKREQGLRTLLIGNTEKNEKGDSNPNLSEGRNEIGINRRRRHNEFFEEKAKNYILPELIRIESTMDSQSLNQEVLCVVEKMNETLNGFQNFSNIKDSILIYKDQMNRGPIEDEQETLNRTKMQNRRYQEIRKELMRNVGWDKVSKCFDILQNMELNHEIELKIILGEELNDKYFGKIIWLKMIEEG